MLFVFFMTLLIGCDDRPLNDPYPNEKSSSNTLFASFSTRPKTLDPAKAYSSNEYHLLYQIYEPPLQYHYLIRPYTLTTQSAKTMPEVKYYDKKDMVVNESSSNIAYSIYTIELESGIQYQPHPAFAKNTKGEYRYLHLRKDYLDDHDINVLSDFKYEGTRTLDAKDYVYQIKRIGSPNVNSPIHGLMSNYIWGLKAFSQKLKKIQEKKGKIDLRQYDISGVKALDKTHYQIKIIGKYQQFPYWLAMPFFAPMPWEAVRFYEQPGMEDKNITLDWYPVGTGPYMLTENNPNKRMVLEKNPYYHEVYYPLKGTEQDIKEGLLRDKGKRLPFVDKILFSLEKEAIPRWNKFLQGYYDISAVNPDSFDGAIHITKSGKPTLTKMMENKHIELMTAVEPSIYVLGFNMLDKVVGGKSDRARKLRRAISIAINYEDYIAIFMNGSGLIAQGPIPPGISGYEAGREGVNPYVYTWDKNKAERLSITLAKQLLKEAGYPNGRNRRTGEPLILNYDVAAGQGPEEKAQFAWFRKQFRKLGISLNVRSTQYNRFQDKLRNGSAQLFSWGWHADYPDPENFLFLLYGPNGKVKFGGENASNYSSKKYDLMFEKMKNIPIGTKRERLIKKMVKLLQFDAPWVWGFYPKTLALKQSWVSKSKISSIGGNTVRYIRVNPELRKTLQSEWNHPVFWPINILFLLILIFIIPIFIAFYIREHQSRRRVKS